MWVARDRTRASQAPLRHRCPDTTGTWCLRPRSGAWRAWLARQAIGHHRVQLIPSVTGTVPAGSRSDRGVRVCWTLRNRPCPWAVRPFAAADADGRHFQRQIVEAWAAHTACLGDTAGGTGGTRSTGQTGAVVCCLLEGTSRAALAEVTGRCPPAPTRRCHSRPRHGRQSSAVQQEAPGREVSERQSCCWDLHLGDLGVYVDGQKAGK
eukprot:3478938-Rhodomonas_salina.2